MISLIGLMVQYGANESDVIVHMEEVFQQVHKISGPEV